MITVILVIGRMARGATIWSLDTRWSLDTSHLPTGEAVITAIVLIDCATASIPEVAQALAALPGVSEVYSVAGHVDLIAIVRVREFDEIAEVIAGGISKVAGVVNPETHIAFRAYSRHDLAEAFAIGCDGAE